MQMTMRWFGPKEDKIPLEHFRQVPCLLYTSDAADDLTTV